MCSMQDDLDGSVNTANIQARTLPSSDVLTRAEAWSETVQHARGPGLSMTWLTSRRARCNHVVLANHRMPCCGVG
jgi:hypothetical protein